MKVYKYPKKEEWLNLLQRPSSDAEDLDSSVNEIIGRVRSGGDAAVRELTARFDGVDISDMLVTDDEIAAAQMSVPEELKKAVAIAKANIERFHSEQREVPAPIETMPGVICWRRSVAIEKVGLYIPAGSAPLFSTVLMLGVPARIAGCREVILCSPPDAEGRINDIVLYTAALCGIRSIYKVGGVQAIAAMAYGTETIPSVYKIFGPGNSYVTCAKQKVSMDVAIDMPAGPSEVAVLADDSCNPAFVASDLLSQAEHGPDSQVILVSDSEGVIERTLKEIELQISTLPRRDIARAALSNSKAILVDEIATGISLLNEYAPEHLILAIKNAGSAADKIINAGSVFIGNYSCESAGDYASGTNHTLPTAGFAKAFSGVSLDSFVKKITFQKISPEGISTIGPAIEKMAEAEQLHAHKRAISIRLEAINGI